VDRCLHCVLEDLGVDGGAGGVQHFSLAPKRMHAAYTHSFDNSVNIHKHFMMTMMQYSETQCSAPSSATRCHHASSN